MALSRKKKIIIGSSVGAIVLIAIIATIFATRKDVPEVTVVSIQTRPELRSTVTSSGEVRPIQFMNLTSEVQGRIEEIYVKEGEKVAKGQPLVRLDPNQFESSTDAQVAAFQSAQDEVRVSQSQVSAAQNNLAQAQQAMNVAQVAVSSARQGVEAAQSDVDRELKNLAIAKRELQRTTQLLEAGVASKLEFDEAKDKVDQAEIAVRNAQSRLKSQSLAVKDANARVAQQSVAVRDARRGVETANLSVNSSQSRANQQTAVLRGQRNQRDKTMQLPRSTASSPRSRRRSERSPSPDFRRPL